MRMSLRNIQDTPYSGQRRVKSVYVRHADRMWTPRGQTALRQKNTEVANIFHPFVLLLGTCGTCWRPLRENNNRSETRRQVFFLPAFLYCFLECVVKAVENKPSLGNAGAEVFVFPPAPDGDTRAVKWLHERKQQQGDGSVRKIGSSVSTLRSAAPFSFSCNFLFFCLFVCFLNFVCPCFILPDILHF